MDLYSTLPEHLRICKAVEVLRNSLNAGRLSHAILIEGEDAEDLEKVGLALAGAVLNTTKPETHPDLFVLRPAKKARQIRIGELHNPEPNTMRWFLHQLMQTANRSGGKVGMIHEADRMNDATANAFLKTLEEPPPNTRLVLLTHRPYDLLDTIRSRCFHFRLPAGLNVGRDGAWQSWLEDYQQWILHLCKSATTPKDRVNAVMGVYGLITRFVQYLNDITSIAWKEEKARLPDHLDDDELSACEVGLQKSLRGKLWRDIAHATRLATHQQATRGPFPTVAYAGSLESLELAAGLLEVNLKEDTALEYFFLKSLRYWAAVGVSVN